MISVNSTESEKSLNEAEKEKEALQEISIQKEKINKFFIQNPKVKADMYKDQVLWSRNEGGSKQAQVQVGFEEELWSKLSKDAEKKCVKKKRNQKNVAIITQRYEVLKSKFDMLDKNRKKRKLLEKKLDKAYSYNQMDQNNNEGIDNSNGNQKAGNTKNQVAGADTLFSFKMKLQQKFRNRNMKAKRATSAKSKPNHGENPAKKLDGPGHQIGAQIPGKKAGNIFDRLYDKNSNKEEKSVIYIDEKLQVETKQGRDLYHDLEKAKDQNEFHLVAKKFWDEYKGNLAAELKSKKSRGGHVLTFKGDNKQFNKFICENKINPEDKSFIMNEDEDDDVAEFGDKDLKNNLLLIDKILKGNVHRKWLQLQHSDI
jgi:hypothetical protein